jgi:hypothetical protein
MSKLIYNRKQLVERLDDIRTQLTAITGGSAISPKFDGDLGTAELRPIIQAEVQLKLAGMVVRDVDKTIKEQSEMADDILPADRSVAAV